MRIAHLVTSGDMAGGQAVALRLARAARETGHEALFVSPTTGVFASEALAAGFPLELVDVTRTIRVGGAARLRRLLRGLDVDLLHTHVHAAAGILGRLAARTAGCAVISHLHIENHFRLNRLARAPLVALDNATARLCTRLIAVSDATRRAFERQGFPGRLIETVYNGVDVEALAAAPELGLRAQLGLEADALVIGCVGRLAAVKGQRELIEATALLRNHEAPVQLVLIGRDLEQGGGYLIALEQAARSRGLSERVRFADFPLDAAAAIRELDVLVLPSWIEGLPLVVLEAMAHATPVVATGVGGTPEAVVNGETGLLVPPRDVAALANALERLLADDDLRARLGRAGRARVSALFDARTMSQRILEVYDDVCPRN